VDRHRLDKKIAVIKERIERLSVCGRGSWLIDQYRQERLRIDYTHLPRVAYVASLSSAPAEGKKNPIEIFLLFFEDIVNILNPLAHLIEQEGGLQGRGTGFHGKSISVQNHSI
jgi:hypothetical protein